MKRLTFAQALAADLTGESIARHVWRLMCWLRILGLAATMVLVITGLLLFYRNVTAVESHPELAYTAMTKMLNSLP
jgi:hypothetical protein